VCCLIVEFIVKVGRSLTFVCVRLALLVGGKLLLAGGKTVPRTQWSSFVSGRRVGEDGMDLRQPWFPRHLHYAALPERKSTGSACERAKNKRSVRLYGLNPMFSHLAFQMFYSSILLPSRFRQRIQW